MTCSWWSKVSATCLSNIYDKTLRIECSRSNTNWRGQKWHWMYNFVTWLSHMACMPNSNTVKVWCSLQSTFKPSKAGQIRMWNHATSAMALCGIYIMLQQCFLNSRPFSLWSTCNKYLKTFHWIYFIHHKNIVQLPVTDLARSLIQVCKIAHVTWFSDIFWYCVFYNNFCCHISIRPIQIDVTLEGHVVQL